MPDYLPQAVIAIEDRRFYSYFGVDSIWLDCEMLHLAMVRCSFLMR